MAFQRILCAVDFSQGSIQAYHIAVEMARQQSKAALHLFHVIEARPVVSEWPPVNGLSEMMLALEEKATPAMESLVEASAPIPAGIAFSTEISTGRALVEILNRAHEWKADLIVLGACGAASLEHAIAGSTAEHVARGFLFCANRQIVECLPFRYGLTMMWFSTFVTPGADHAARSASSFSAHARTVP
jgi:nucleotide-binding universal stress UspA family protein